MSEPTTIREALEASIGNEEPEQEVVATSAEPVAEAAPQTAESEPVEVAAEPAAESGEADLHAIVEEKPEADGRQRDEQGKFKKAEGIKPGPKSGPKSDKAPASWKPDTREHWANLPDSVKSEVIRRESELQRTLHETAEARKYADQVSRTLAPYEAYMRAEGANPLQAIDNLMATAVRLRTGTGPELAGLMAGMVKQFGTGRFGNDFIHMLDSALAGVAPQQDNQTAQLQQVIQQQLAPVQQFMTQMQSAQAQAQQRIQQQAGSEVEQFINTAEFGNDVREDMADLMELAAKRGKEMTLQDAYQQACMANPLIREVLQKRGASQMAQTQSGVAQRARAAAVSVPSAGPAMGAQQFRTDDTRSAIEAAIAMHGR